MPEDRIDPLNDSDLTALVYRLANALWHHRDAWDENGSEDYNRRHRAEIEAALDAARQIGWLPDAE